MLWNRSDLGDADLFLEAERVHLRPPSPDDYKNWAQLREESRAFLIPWEPSWPQDSLSPAAYRRRIRRYGVDRRAGTGCSFFIFRNTDGALLGGISLGNIKRAASQSASVGYWIGAPHARQGYMTEALACVVAFGFDRLSLHRIEAACLAANEPSRILLQKMGFKLEGQARKYLRINGVWQDHEIYALLREECDKTV